MSTTDSIQLYASLQGCLFPFFLGVVPVVVLLPVSLLHAHVVGASSYYHKILPPTPTGLRGLRASIAFACLAQRLAVVAAPRPLWLGPIAPRIGDTEWKTVKAKNVFMHH
eukprot:scaffold34597_cov177-Amphora_coffeaeformis.AAC.9